MGPDTNPTELFTTADRLKRSIGAAEAPPGGRPVPADSGTEETIPSDDTRKMAPFRTDMATVVALVLVGGMLIVCSTVAARAYPS